VTEEEKQEANEKDVVITDHREVLSRLKDYM
jgi:ERCC4-type nuclease